MTTHTKFDRDVLHAFLFFKETSELHALLDKHPGLEEYVIPALALMRAIGNLSIIDQARRMTPIIGSDGKAEIIDLHSMPDGRISAQRANGPEISAAQHAPDIIKAAQFCSMFLTQEAYDLLEVFEENQPDAETTKRMRLHREALGICLENGLDRAWYNEQESDAEGMSVDQQQEDVRGPMADLLRAESQDDLAPLLERASWLNVYVEELPIGFSPPRIRLQKAVADFCFDGTWPARWRAVKKTPALISPEGEAVIQQIAKTAEAHHEPKTVHERIADIARIRLKSLRALQDGDVDAILLDEAANGVDYWIM